MHTLFDLYIGFQGVYPKNMQTKPFQDVCINMYSATLFVIAFKKIHQYGALKINGDI